jgi:hypothetical protein
MKTFINISISVFFILFGPSLVNGQTSKSCGSCHNSVSVYSQVGDYCPHCGVRWGYENTTTSTSYVNDYNYYNYDYYTGMSSTGYVNANSNLRSYASKSAYVVTVVPKYSTITILGKYGSWYHVEYQEGYWNTKTGYIHQSLVSI